MAETYVLDSFAILAFLGKEEGGEMAADLLRWAQAGKVRALMTWVNMGEVAYIVERRWGTGQVYQVLGILEATGIEIVPAGRDVALTAAHIEAERALSYADAFAAALALQEEAILVTGDPEFKCLEERLAIRWIGQ